MPVTDDDGLRELLSMDPVAVVGCSTTPGKAAHDIPAYLQDHGCEVIPVNPYADEVLGREAYDSLADVDEEIALVDVFRPSEEVEGIVDDVLARHEDRGDVDGVWLQLGITDDEALARAEGAGLATTQDRCMKVEHGRLIA
ncbi:CoA-binding protein [Halobaculum sp. WSA2]|uniref:CoA-binding protein n=1 Tax=Halobaculum saliterrae TaxID=2073113 RepID=A0A6B0SXH9_9EURY|nr:CoA-binding protein [Halobaculum saliterrae]MXR41002.1 CoA-binding protein [Halobaculum saliterrae]